MNIIVYCIAQYKYYNIYIVINQQRVHKNKALHFVENE